MPAYARAQAVQRLCFTRAACAAETVASLSDMAAQILITSPCTVHYLDREWMVKWRFISNAPVPNSSCPPPPPPPPPTCTCVRVLQLRARACQHACAGLDRGTCSGRMLGADALGNLRASSTRQSTRTAMPT